MLFAIQLDHPAPGQPWQALRAAAAFDASLGKIFIAVDADIDPNSMDAVLWALSYSMQPHRDIEIIRGKVPRLDPSIAPAEGSYPDGRGASAMLINACREHPYLPVSLPRREFMEKAIERWKLLSLPELDLKSPWFGYPLSAWTDENAAEAELATRGQYLETGERLSKLRRPAAEANE
jgi:4-hydroxy-3-polyprenylbenzoate decarboxylase